MISTGHEKMEFVQRVEAAPYGRLPVIVRYPDGKTDVDGFFIMKHGSKYVMIKPTEPIMWSVAANGEVCDTSVCTKHYFVGSRTWRYV